MQYHAPNLGCKVQRYCKTRGAAYKLGNPWMIIRTPRDKRCTGFLKGVLREAARRRCFPSASAKVSGRLRGAGSAAMSIRKLWRARFAAEYARLRHRRLIRYCCCRWRCVGGGLWSLPLLMVASEVPPTSKQGKRGRKTRTTKLNRKLCFTLCYGVKLCYAMVMFKMLTIPEF